MRGGVLQVDLQEAHEPLFDLLAQKDPNVEGPLAVDIKILTRLGRTAGAARWPVGASHRHFKARRLRAIDDFLIGIKSQLIVRGYLG